jgi:hypothetical protein
VVHLGNLQTLWSDLGGLRTEITLSSEKFRVRDVLNVLESPKCADRTALETIKDYMARISQIDIVITIRQEDGGELRICDGNKRTVAYYETVKARPKVDFKFSERTRTGTRLTGRYKLRTFELQVWFCF